MSRTRFWLPAAAIVLTCVLAYVPAMQGGYVWDDDDYVTNNITLRTADGLRRIWFQFGAIRQYYPLVHTTFWIEYHLWGLKPFGFHLVNVLLHSANAVLLFFLLRRLSVFGAWMAAAVFALHPVHVESVAWITERKNVLSGLFYLASMLAYLRFCQLEQDDGTTKRRWDFYAVSLILFAAALLSKTVVCTLPAALLVLTWWKRRRVRWADLAPLVPFFVLGGGLGLLTAWMEKYHVGAEGGEWGLSPIERVLVAGRALWFYVGKLLYPHDLTFIYPRWHVDAAVAWQYLYPLAAVGVMIALYLLRDRIGRGPLAAVLVFAGTLFPALGFFDVYPHRYSFVADHFQYLASIGMIVLFTAAVAEQVRALSLRRRRLARGLAGIILLLLAGKTWKQGYIYRDLETLWSDTLVKNPDCWMAHTNLGKVMADKGNVTEARFHYDRALAIYPDYYELHYNLGNLLARENQLDEAIDAYRRAIELAPAYPKIHHNLGVAYLKRKDIPQAVDQFKRALELNPNLATTHVDLAIALLHQGQSEQALDHLGKALRLDPDRPDAYSVLGALFTQQGKIDQAIQAYRYVLKVDPNYEQARQKLHALERLRKPATAPSPLP